jgi:hypothetical protein
MKDLDEFLMSLADFLGSIFDFFDINHGLII